MAMLRRTPRPLHAPGPSRRATVPARLSAAADTAEQRSLTFGVVIDDTGAILRRDVGAGDLPALHAVVKELLAAATAPA